MLIETPFKVYNHSGDVVRGDLRFTRGTTGAPLLIILHGFTAHKDWGPFPHLGRQFAGLGFSSIVFNFSHNGIGSNFRKFTEADKFSRNTIGKELEDVQAVIRAVTAGEVGNEVVDPARLGMIGHSRGGGVAILAGSRDLRIRGIAAWSTVSTFHRYTDHQKSEWERQGFLPVTIRGSKTNLRFGIEVLRDLEANRESYDLRAAVRNLRVPLLLLHGSADVSVKPQEPGDLYEAADKSKTEFVLLPGVGHTYGATHPFHPHNATVEHIINLTSRWFHLFL